MAERSYRQRNIVLACIAAAAVVAAAIRVSLGPPPPAATAVTAPASAMPATANAPNGAVTTVTIPVQVSMGPDIELPATTTVFLIVRAPDSGPMPLAVKRMTVADLPAEVTLSDADAMVAGRSLRDAGVVQLVARASVSGDVRAGPGDFEGSSGELRIPEIRQPISLVIDRAL